MLAALSNWSVSLITSNDINICPQQSHNTLTQAITYWVFKEVMILRSHRHHTEEEVEGYRLHSRLTINNVNSGDYGAYKCVSKNSLGETEGQIRLYGEGYSQQSVQTVVTLTL